MKAPSSKATAPHRVIADVLHEPTSTSATPVANTSARLAVSTTAQIHRSCGSMRSFSKSKSSAKLSVILLATEAYAPAIEPDQTRATVRNLWNSCRE